MNVTTEKFSDTKYYLRYHLVLGVPCKDFTGVAYSVRLVRRRVFAKCLISRHSVVSLNLNRTSHYIRLESRRLGHSSGRKVELKTLYGY